MRRRRKERSERGKAYTKFLQTELWKQMAEECKERSGRECDLCGETENLHAHHTSYPEKWEETTQDQLQCLCSVCHSIEHDKWSPLWNMECFNLIHKRMMADHCQEGPSPSEREIEVLCKLVETRSHQWACAGFIRFVVSMRMSRRQFETWLKATDEAKKRQFKWSLDKVLKLRGSSLPPVLDKDDPSKMDFTTVDEVLELMEPGEPFRFSKPHLQPKWFKNRRLLTTTANDLQEVSQ